MIEENLELLTTESRNQETMQIDTAEAIDILRIMNEQDQLVALAVKEVLPEVEAAVQFVFESFKNGGRLIYLGAGTSGRLGVLDAVECPPTFSTEPEMVVGLMAGGEGAFLKAVEGAEDDPELGVNDLKQLELTEHDTVIGIAASGRTPYVIGALRYARSIGAKTVALSCNKNAAISKEADQAIEVIVGPEVLTGSTRLKSGTAHKMILNMISTSSMILLGKAYENLMVDVKVSNLKLKERAIGIIGKITGVSYEAALETLEKSDLQVKTAIVMIMTESTKQQAEELLAAANGYVKNGNPEKNDEVKVVMCVAAGGLTMLQNMLDQLPASERKIAQYILENPRSILNSTVNDIGTQAKTSGAAVIRLCKSLGLNGFQDLKVRIAGDLVKPKAEQGYRDIEPGESYYSIVQKTTSNSIQSIRDSEEIINYEELERGVQTLLHAQNVHFFGIGASNIIAKDAQQKFLRIQKNATAFTDTHLVATLIANAGKDDVVFAISHSGETAEVVKVMALAKERGVKTISLTKYGQSSVASLADIKLYTSYSGEAAFRSAATSSRLAQLYMMDILFLSMATVQYEQTIQAIDQTREAIRFIKESN